MDCKLIIFSFIRNFVRGMLIMYMLVKIHLRLVFTGDGVIVVVVVEVVGALPTQNRESESKEESSTGRNWKNENGFIFFRFPL